jgi:hypothetical protein
MPRGPLPVFFPEKCVMVVGHNFDAVDKFRLSVARGMEALGALSWRKLLEVLDVADVHPEKCFFTNALMGLQPFKSVGQLETTPRFRQECRDFFEVQCEIVRPRAVVVLGEPAKTEVKQTNIRAPVLYLSHPASMRRDGASMKSGELLARFLAQSALSQ